MPGGASGTANVTPSITSISPANGLIGASTSVTISGSGFGASRGSSTVSAGDPAITFQYNTWSDTQIGVTFQVGSNAYSGKHSNVTVTTPQGTSNTTNFYVQVPYSASYISSISQGSLSQAQCTALGAPAGSAGYQRLVTLQLQDNRPAGIYVSGVTVADTLTPPPGNAFGMGTATGSTPTDSSGEWPDQYYVCTTACPGSGAQVVVPQSWTANNMQMGHVNSIVYKCTSITIDGN